MNVDENHLIKAGLVVPNPKDYEILPSELEHAARLVLKDRSEAKVSRTSGGRLSRYAAKRRKEKRKAAKAARKRNRR